MQKNENKKLVDYIHPFFITVLLILISYKTFFLNGILFLFNSSDPQSFHFLGHRLVGYLFIANVFIQRRHAGNYCQGGIW